MEHKLSAGSQAVLQLRVYIDFEIFLPLERHWICHPGNQGLLSSRSRGLELDNIPSNPDHSVIL